MVTIARMAHQARQLKKSEWSSRYILTFVYKNQQHATVKVFLFVDTNFRGFYKMHRAMGS